MPLQPDIEQRAREMLAAEWDNHVGEPDSGWMAEQLRKGWAIGHPQIYAIRAITKALASSVPEDLIQWQPDGVAAKDSDR